MLHRRTKGKHNIDFGRPQFMKYVMNNLSNEDIKNLNGKSISELLNAVKDYNKTFIERLCNTGSTYDLPYKCGMMYISRNKPRIIKTLFGKRNLFRVDWKETEEFRNKYPEKIYTSTTGKIFHINRHTGTDILKFTWDKDTLRHAELRFYRFQPTRISQRYLASVAKDPLRKVDYYKKEYAFKSEALKSYKQWRQKER